MSQPNSAMHSRNLIRQTVDRLQNSKMSYKDTVLVLRAVVNGFPEVDMTHLMGYRAVLDTALIAAGRIPTPRNLVAEFIEGMDRSDFTVDNSCAKAAAEHIRACRTLLKEFAEVCIALDRLQCHNKASLADNMERVSPIAGRAADLLKEVPLDE